MELPRGRSVPPRFMAVLLLAVLAATSSDAADVQPTVGHRAPDFTLRDSDGTPVQLSRVLGERAVLVNFWATWCPTCREEMPTMERAYRDYRSKGLEVLAVSIDAGSDAAGAAKVKEFMAELGLTFSAVLDVKGEVTRTYRLRGLPTTFLIDRQGVVRAAEIGYRDWAGADSLRKLEGRLK